MTLLDASITLVDAARQLPENRALKGAIKRMEKRIQVLQLRSRKAFRRRRWRAWYHACADAGDVWNSPLGRRLTDPICMSCFHMVQFSQFCHIAEFNSRGLLSLCCPHCGYCIAGLSPVIDEDLEAQRFTDGDWLPGH